MIFKAQTEHITTCLPISLIFPITRGGRGFGQKVGAPVEGRFEKQREEKWGKQSLHHFRERKCIPSFPLSQKQPGLMLSTSFLLFPMTHPFLRMCLKADLILVLLACDWQWLDHMESEHQGSIPLWNTPWFFLLIPALSRPRRITLAWKIINFPFLSWTKSIFWRT